MSPVAWPSKVAYAVPSSKWLASMRDTQVHLGSPATFFVMLLQLLPPSRVICTLPSSVPTQIRSEFFGDSQIVKMVQWFSALELSTESPPDSPCLSLAGSLVLRSGEMRSQASPRSRERNRNCA